MKILKDRVSDRAWGSVDKGALGKALADGFAEGSVSRGLIAEVYAFVSPDAFGKGEDGKPAFAYSKGWGPHHELDGESIVLNRAGLGAAAAALAGGRSEPGIEGAALSSAKAHVRRHYAEIKEPAPDGLGETRGEGNKETRGRRIQESAGVAALEEAAGDGKKRRVRVERAMQAGVVNGNMRRYAAPVLEAAVAELGDHLNESAGQGRAIELLGEAEHPSEKGTRRPNLLETVIKWIEVEWDGRDLNIIGNILETSKGQDIRALMEGGVKPGISMRGYGDSAFIGEGVDRIEEVLELHITGFDLVLEPSFENAAVLESQQRIGNETNLRGDVEMDPKELQKLIGEHPEWFKGMFEGEVKAALSTASEAQLKALEERIRKELNLAPEADLSKALAEMADAKRKLDEAEKAQEVRLAIAEATKDLPYGEMNTLFIEAIVAETLRFAQSDKPAAAVKALVEAKRKEYDAIAAKAKLAAMGYKVEVKGPVLEAETGIPEFARGAHEFYESLVRSGHVVRRNMAKAASINELQTAQLLERFDKLYKTQLMRESRQMQEAELATDLNLPYSVSRAILQSVWPELVATSVFDMGTTDQAPSRVYYETYANESGVVNSITDEDVTLVSNAWVALAHKFVQPGTLVVETTGGSAYAEGADYVADYLHGQVKMLSTGSISPVTVHCDYTYDALREGENTAIQRAEVNLAYVTLEIAANRLAQQITNEAVVFARSQIGWDATTRTLASLVNQLRRKIDKALMYNALSAALGVVSNTGGTWTAASDPIINFISYIGVSKVLVAKRFYVPTGVLVSATNSDRIGNWDGFTAAGKRPDSDLNANGYVGRIKGLPVFQSTEFPDSYALVLNRELLAYRIFQPMILKGPFPSYSSTNLVAADQWYAEQYDGSVCPVPGKGSTVKVV